MWKLDSMTDALLIIGGVLAIYGMAPHGWPFSIAALVFHALAVANAYWLRVKSVEVHRLWPLEFTVTWLAP